MWDEEQPERTGKTFDSKQELTVATWDVDFQTDHKIQAKRPYSEQYSKIIQWTKRKEEMPADGCRHSIKSQSLTERSLKAGQILEPF